MDMGKEGQGVWTDEGGARGVDMVREGQEVWTW